MSGGTDHCSRFYHVFLQEKKTHFWSYERRSVEQNRSVRLVPKHYITGAFPLVLSTAILSSCQVSSKGRAGEGAVLAYGEDNSTNHDKSSRTRAKHVKTDSGK